MWTLLADEAAWIAYRTQIAQQMGITGMSINWGTGPREYPCMVCSYMPPPGPNAPRPVSAYMYLADAENLFKAAGRTTVDPDAQRPPSQSSFNRWVSAHLLTMVHFLVETSICKEGQYEEALAIMLEKVDTWGKEDAAKFARTEQTILQSLEHP